MRSYFALLACLALLVAGCGGTTEAKPSPSVSIDSSVGGTPTATASGSASSTSSASGSAMTKPQLPTQAQEYTVKGAEAFVRYYIEAQNYASQTGDTSLMARAAAASCTVCQSLIKDANAMYGRGEYLVGGIWKPRSLMPTQMQESKISFGAVMDSNPQVQYSKDKKILKRYSGMKGRTVTFTAGWRANSWSLLTVGL